MNGKTWHASFPLPWHSAHSHLALLSSNQTSTTILHIFIHSVIRSSARVKIDCCPSVRGRQSLYSRGGSLSVTLYPEESRKLVWSCLRRNKIATRRCRGLLLRGQLEHKGSSAGFLSIIFLREVRGFCPLRADFRPCFSTRCAHSAE